MISIKEEDVKKQEAKLKELRKKLRETMDEYERIDLNPGQKRLKAEDMDTDGELSEAKHLVNEAQVVKGESESDLKPEIQTNEQPITA
jgi:hypothetical protein